jgi:hypothetical protein
LTIDINALHIQVVTSPDQTLVQITNSSNSIGKSRVHINTKTIYVGCLRPQRSAYFFAKNRKVEVKNISLHFIFGN